MFAHLLAILHKASIRGRILEVLADFIRVMSPVEFHQLCIAANEVDRRFFLQVWRTTPAAERHIQRGGEWSTTPILDRVLADGCEATILAFTASNLENMASLVDNLPADVRWLVTTVHVGNCPRTEDSFRLAA